MNKIIMKFVACLFIVLALCTTVNAQTIVDIEAELNRLQEENRKKVEDLNNKKFNLNIALNDEKNASNEELQIRNKIKELEVELTNVRNTINQYNEEIPLMKNKADNSMRILQQNQNNNFLIEQLFATNQDNNSFRRVMITKQLTDDAMNTIQELQRLTEELKVKQEELNNQTNILKIKEKELENKKNYLIEVRKKIAKETASSEKEVVSNTTIIESKKQYAQFLKDQGCGPTDRVGIDCAQVVNISGLRRPTVGTHVTSEYLRDPHHKGIDIGKYGGSEGVPVYAAGSGKVIFSSYDSTMGGGNMVHILHVINGKEFVTEYSHMSVRNVSLGQTVSSDTMIGRIGNTGNSFGAHLHFGINRGNKWGHIGGGAFINPRSMVNFPPIHVTWNER